MKIFGLALVLEKTMLCNSPCLNKPMGCHMATKLLFFFRSVESLEGRFCRSSVMMYRIVHPAWISLVLAFRTVSCNIFPGNLGGVCVS